MKHILRHSCIVLILGWLALGQTVPTTPNLHLPLPPAGTKNWDLLWRQQNNALDSTLFGGAIAPKSLNNIQFADQFAGVDVCAKINAAALALPASGGIVDARGFQGSQTCSTNPFANLATKNLRLLLGATTITTTAMWTLEESQTVIGSGRDNTGIIADSSFNFTTNKSVLRIGSTAAVDGARFENLHVNCSSVANGVGIYSAWAQEQSGLRDILAVNCLGKGLWWETNSANNSFMDNVEVLNFSGNASATIPVLIDDVKGWRGLNGITINNNGTSPNPAVCLKIDNATTGTFTNIHPEYCTTGIDIGASTGVQGVTISSVFPSNTITHAVKIEGPSTPTSSVVLLNVNKGSATNTIYDVENSATITDSVVPMYVAGSGMTSYFQSTIKNNSLSVPQSAGTPTTNRAVCWKTATTLGYCSTQPDTDGACTCN